MSTTPRKAVTRIILDVANPDVQKAVSITQGDVNRRFEVTLVDGGRPFPMQVKWTAALVGIKPDGKNLFNSCVTDNGKIIYDFAGGEEISTAAGGFAVQFEIYDEVGDTLASPRIWITVIPFQNREMASKDQYTAAREILARLNWLEESKQFLPEINKSDDGKVLIVREGKWGSDRLTPKDSNSAEKNHEHPYLTLGDGKIEEKGSDLSPESRALTIRVDTAGLHFVKVDTSAGALEMNALEGRWVIINGQRAYIGSNTVDTLVLFTDETKSTPAAMTVTAGDVVYPADVDVTEELRELLGAEAVSVDLSAMDTTGEIIETYADETTKTTKIEFDEEGNPIRITDSSGHVTTITW
jgi:YD repeat-containing protein